MMSDNPPVCDYTDSDYQASFWDTGERRYEDAVEEIALQRLMGTPGHLLLELGAGAGRNTLRYGAWERIVLLDYSRTQLEQARERLGEDPRFVYVAADIYKLPFVNGLFDGATMIRTLHHMADPYAALASVQRVLAGGARFVLEFANKRNIKAIARYFLGKQTWNPFTPDPVEFVALNYNFHPVQMRKLLRSLNFKIERQLSVSFFRANFLKRRIPHRLLTGMDKFLQPSGKWVQLAPSIFSRLRREGITLPVAHNSFFACPVCGQSLPDAANTLVCPGCKKVWEYREGIYDFRSGEHDSH
jgi:ubiquinone/menaquinone biosynthesis C-methylase UbiE